jgi:hypothetical protein
MFLPVLLSFVGPYSRNIPKEKVEKEDTVTESPEENFNKENEKGNESIYYQNPGYDEYN